MGAYNQIQARDIDGNIAALNRHLAEEERQEAEADYLAELTDEIAMNLMSGGEYKYGKAPSTHFGFENILEDIIEDTQLHMLLAKIADGRNIEAEKIRDLMFEHALLVAADVVPHYRKRMENEHGH